MTFEAVKVSNLSTLFWTLLSSCSNALCTSVPVITLVVVLSNVTETAPLRFCLITVNFVIQYSKACCAFSLSCIVASFSSIWICVTVLSYSKLESSLLTPNEYISLIVVSMLSNADWTSEPFT